MTRNGGSLLLVLVVMAGGVLLGCQSGQPSNSPQKYDYAEVKRRLKRLPQGSTAIDVMATLGSPAQQSREAWIYMPDRTGLIIPAEYLRVNFVRGRYASHDFKAVVLGERMK